jgi:hypothetical protein
MPEAKDLARKDFQLELDRANLEVRDEYSKLLIEERARLAKENGEKLVEVPVEKREELLKQADVNVRAGHVDSEKTERGQENANPTPEPQIKDPAAGKWNVIPDKILPPEDHPLLAREEARKERHRDNLKGGA